MERDTAEKVRTLLHLLHLLHPPIGWRGGVEHGPAGKGGAERPLKGEGKIARTTPSTPRKKFADGAADRGRPASHDPGAIGSPLINTQRGEYPQSAVWTGLVTRCKRA